VTKNPPAIVSGLLLSLALAVFICFVSNNLHSRFQHRQETIQQQFAILAGEPYPLDGTMTYFPQFQNRVLFAFVLRLMTRTGVSSVGRLYLVLRLVTAWLAFFIFWALLRNCARADDKVAAVGIGMLAYGLVFTFNHGWEHPTDFLDVIAISLMLWATLRRRLDLLLVVSIVAAANRESSVFGGLIWCFLYGRSRDGRWRLREVLRGSFATGVSGIAVLALRYAIGGSKGFAGPVTTEWIGVLGSLIEFLRAPNPSGWPLLAVAMFLPLGWWAWKNAGQQAWQERQLRLCGMAIAIICSFLAIISELRGLIPTFVLFTYGAVVTEMSSERKSQAIAA
jgi:hypothetical protein